MYPDEATLFWLARVYCIHNRTVITYAFYGEKMGEFAQLATTYKAKINVVTVLV